MKRRFVNLVLESPCPGGSFTMHGIRSSSLFHPKKHNGIPRPPISLLEEAEPPKPACTLGLCTRREDGGEFMFMPFGSSRDKTVSAEQDGTVLVHDIGQKKLSSRPRLKGWNHHSVAITLGDDLYLIARCPSKPERFRPSYPGQLIDRCHDEPDLFLPYQNSFEALIHGEPPADVQGLRLPGWYWHSLPLPTYVETSGYKPSCGSKIVSATVVRDSIWVSAMGGIGTYSFDKGSRQWSKVGSWVLPFGGDAQYVPELDRWLGFSCGDSQFRPDYQFLCASDLSAAAADGAAPTLCRLWGEDIAKIPWNWKMQRSDLVRVGSGKFCVARLFHVYDPYPFIKESFAVCTGVELERSDATEHGIQVVKHKTIRYNFHGKLLQLVC